MPPVVKDSECPDEVASPFGGLVDMLHVGTHLFGGAGPVGVQLRQGHDRLQDVVQFVREPAGDGARR